MNEIEHLLTILSEECAEVAQRASKAARFGMTEIQPGQHENNTRRLERELADLMAVADLLGLCVREEDKVAKIEKLKKFMAYSREMGTLETRDRLLLQNQSMRTLLEQASCSFHLRHMEKGDTTTPENCSKEPCVKIRRACSEERVKAEPQCWCGKDNDPTGMLPRRDIVCPKHDRK